MEKQIEKQIHKEKLRKYKNGILGGLFVVLLITATSLAIIKFVDLDESPVDTVIDDTGDNNPPGNHTQAGFLTLLEAQLSENYENIAYITVYQNITKDDNLVSIDGQFKKINNDTWEASLFIITIPLSDLSNISIIDESSLSVPDSDIQDVNNLLIQGVNNSIVLDDLNSTYDPRMSAIYIQILYNDGSGIVFFWENQADENPNITYGELTWIYNENYDYIESVYNDTSMKFLSPSSVFNPLLVKLDEIFPVYNQVILGKV